MPFPLDHYIEASHVDYKERLEEKKPRSWLKSVSAFANTEGGHLIFGVKNEPREVVGLEKPCWDISKPIADSKAQSAGCGEQIDGTY